MQKKKKQAGVLERCLTRFFEGNIRRGFIYLYSDLTMEMHQLVFRGFQPKKRQVSLLVGGLKNLHTQ